MDATEQPPDVVRGIKSAASRREEAEQRFRRMLVLGRDRGMPLALIADAAGLSTSRVHAILKEEKTMQATVPGLVRSYVATDDVLIVAARIAYDDYLHLAAYICQDGRSFRDVVRMGFYRHGRIERHFPAIRAIEDHVLFSDEDANRRRQTGSPIDRELAALIETAPSYYRKWEGEPHKVFLLTPPDDPRTLVLPYPILHDTSGRGSAFTMGQRYVGEAALLTEPPTTTHL